MSEALTPESPETFAAAPSVEDPAPVGETAVQDGSAGEADPKMVEATRFNGLMSKFNQTQSELEAARRQVAELSNRINNQETAEVADENTLDEVRQLREELRAERLQAAKARVLEQYPAAVPLADLIVGDTAEQIESVAAAIAQRLEALNPADQPGASAEGATQDPPAPAPASEEAPVIGGGGSSPVIPSTNDAVSAALQQGDWNAYLAAKLGPSAQANLG
jgi:hypothetical protein